MLALEAGGWFWQASGVLISWWLAVWRHLGAPGLPWQGASFTGHVVAPLVADLGSSLAWGHAASLPPLRVPLPGTQGRFSAALRALFRCRDTGKEDGLRPSWSPRTSGQMAALGSCPALWELVSERQRRYSVAANTASTVTPR